MYEWVSLWPKDGGRPHGECGKPAFIGTTDEGRKTLNFAERVTKKRVTSTEAYLKITSGATPPEIDFLSANLLKLRPELEIQPIFTILGK